MSQSEIHFTKMHGLGNDFAVLDLVNRPMQITPDMVRRLADRHFGIGFDQLLTVEPGGEEGVHFTYRIYNVDGTEVEHCGNGARCFARYVREKGLSDANPLIVRTVNRRLSLHTDDDGNVAVDMGVPELSPSEIPLQADAQALTYKATIDVAGDTREIEFAAVSMGNPHAVIFVEDLAQTAVKEIGEALGSHPVFPEGVNVGFAQIQDRSNIKLRVFERGSGETLACGTGACAAVVAGCLGHKLDGTVSVSLPGGTLSIAWPGNGKAVTMTGPATTVYEGIVKL